MYLTNYNIFVIITYVFKAFKFRINPNEAQKVLLQKHFGCTRFIYNWALATKTQAYKTENVNISRFELQAKLPEMKKGDYQWLKEVNSLSLQATLEHLDKAYTKFFREKKGYPNFKSKKTNRHSFSVPQSTKVDFENNKLFIPKFKEGIKCIFHRKFSGKIKTCTVSQTPTGKYYISILVEIDELPQKKKPISEKQAIAFDLGIKSFLVASNQDVIENPKYLKTSLFKLKKVQRRLSKKVKGSSNRNKARLKVALLHEKITNQRHDFLHKLTYKYVSNNQYNTFCMEDLAVSNMVKNHCLAQSISDVSWSSFVEYLTYKAEWLGKNILKIGRWEASSKTCSNCGTIKKDLKLSDRIFKCDSCKVELDRDYNAALNIKDMAFQKQNLIGIL